jgi:hypothetical protein
LDGEALETQIGTSRSNLAYSEQRIELLLAGLGGVNVNAADIDKANRKFANAVKAHQMLLQTLADKEGMCLPPCVDDVDDVDDVV